MLDFIAQFCWVIATCPPKTRHARICQRGRAMDATKIATGMTPDPALVTPADAVLADLGCPRTDYAALARKVALEMAPARFIHV
ncbi:MAG: hypothetical protein ACYDHP_14525 [Ferrimicrobium sp.]